MKVVLADAAKQDLIRIGDYIPRDNPQRALNVRADAPRYAHAGLRRRVVRDYLIFYRIDRGRISVIHIPHGAQDYDRLLLAEEVGGAGA